jgi:hypothetical protein
MNYLIFEKNEVYDCGITGSLLLRQGCKILLNNRIIGKNQLQNGLIAENGNIIIKNNFFKNLNIAIDIPETRETNKPKIIVNDNDFESIKIANRMTIERPKENISTWGNKYINTFVKFECRNKKGEFFEIKETKQD